MPVFVIVVVAVVPPVAAAVAVVFAVSPVHIALADCYLLLPFLPILNTYQMAVRKRN